ncbi:MAG TPA: sulfatase [Polyangiaceae bacterium]|nr:sulfatase [Polyangiaceae bacterium]
MSISWKGTWRGLLGASAGALVGAGLSSFLDARAATSASGTSGLLGACLGLSAPLALLVGASSWGLRLAFLSGEAFDGVAFWHRLGQSRGGARAAWLLTPPLLALAIPPGLLAVAGVTARTLSMEATGGTGVALAALPLLLALAAGLRVVVVALSEYRALERWSPRLVLLASLALLVGGVGLLIAVGETSGAGGPFRILGVLRRQELDLRAPGLLLLILAAGLLWPSPGSALKLALAALLVAGSAYLTLRAARSVSLPESAALAVERHAPLSRIALALLRRATDRDRDGVSAAFAGGDCDDRNAKISPRAVDVPGNGRDEDCLDGDAKPVALTAAPIETAGTRQRLAPDLNLLLVTIDTLRADLGYMGYGRPVSPTLDALARKSVVFERAYALASYTGKSMGPLLIGKYASELEGGFLHFNRYSKRETFVQQRLQAAGVRTLSVQGYWYFYKDAGFERGFDVIDSSAAPKVAAIEGDQTSNSDKQSDAAIELLQAPELGQQRFFMWIHYVDPHAEYAPHPEHDFGPKSRDRYDGEVAFVDHHLGRVMAALRQQPLGARTAVIVTSDHGEAFGEHGMIRHGFELWEELVRVPLIVSVPGVAARRVSARRSGIDLVPTILELFGVPLPGAAEALSGQSLLSDVLRLPGEADPMRPVFIDMARGPYNAERQALIEGDLKVTASEGRVLGLFDLAADPGEKRDLALDKQLAAKARSSLATFKSRLRRVPMPER